MSRASVVVAVLGWMAHPPIGCACPWRNRTPFESNHRPADAAGVAPRKMPGGGACRTRWMGMSVPAPRRCGEVSRWPCARRSAGNGAAGCLLAGVDDLGHHDDRRHDVEPSARTERDGVLMTAGAIGVEA